MNAINIQYPRLMSSSLYHPVDLIDGFINICGKDYYIHIETPNFPSARNINISADIELQEIFHSCNVESLKEVQKNCTVLQYLNKLRETCERKSDDDSCQFSYNLEDDQHMYFSLLLSHVDDVGWEKVSHISTDFSLLHLQFRDEMKREHILRLKLLSNYPDQTPDVDTDLPAEAEFNIESCKTLASIYEIWKEQLMKLQLFWNILDDLDQTALIIDPAKPLRKHNTRRILLENQVSLHLTVSPSHPLAPPKCQLLGPSSLVTPLTERLLEVYQRWDESESIVYNLERLLKVTVVKKLLYSKESEEDVSDMDDLNIDCAVCYSLRLEDQLPDFTCDHCQKSFHFSCLYDWLRSLPSSRQSAHYIRGDCPHCTKKITHVRSLLFFKASGENTFF